MSRVKAPIWDYFKIVAADEKYCICSVCSERVSRGGKTVKTFNTSNMIDHVRKKHPNDYKDYESKKKIQEIKKLQEITDKQTATKGRHQLTLSETQARVKQWDINDSNAVRIHRKIAEMMAIDYQPFSIVSDVGFTRLLKTLEPRYNVPSRKYFTENVVPRIKQDIDTRLAELIKDVPFISLTTDIWSANLTNESLISMTAHWVNESFNRLSAVLHAQKIEGSHSGIAICHMLEAMLDTWNISKERVHLVLSDNAANMKKALREAYLRGQGCFAHSLQLVVNDDILSQRSVIDTLAVSRKIVGHFKHSTLAYYKLDEIRVRLNIKKHKLQQDKPQGGILHCICCNQSMNKKWPLLPMPLSMVV